MQIKTGMGGIRGGHGEGLFIGLEEVLTNHSATQKIEAFPLQSCNWFRCRTN